MGNMLYCFMKSAEKRMDKYERKTSHNSGNDIIGNACQDYVNKNGGSMNINGRTFNSNFAHGF